MLSQARHTHTDTPMGVWWKLSHLLSHRGGRYGKCLLCHIIIHQGEGWWLYYIGAAWLLLELGLLSGR